MKVGQVKEEAALDGSDVQRLRVGEGRVLWEGAENVGQRLGMPPVLPFAVTAILVVRAAGVRRRGAKQGWRARR